MSGTPDWQVYRSFVATFGSDEGIIVFFRTDGLTAAALGHLYGVVEGVHGLASLLDLLPSETLSSRTATVEVRARGTVDFQASRFRTRSRVPAHAHLWLDRTPTVGTSMALTAGVLAPDRK